MMRFLARVSCEYSKVFEADSLQEALDLAIADGDVGTWDTTWSEIEVEEEEDTPTS